MNSREQYTKNAIERLERGQEKLQQEMADCRKLVAELRRLLEKRDEQV